MKKNIYAKFIVTTILCWAGCSVVFALVYLLFLGPQNRKLSEIQDKLTETKQLCEAAEKATTQAAQEELSKQLANIKSKINDYVIDEKDSADMTFAISKIASEKNVSEFNIRTSDQQTQNTTYKNIFERRIEVDFTSGFNQFAGFLNTLERNQPVVFVDNFRMSRSNENPSGHKFNMALVVLVRKKAE